MSIYALIWAAIFIVVLGWSAVRPHDYPTWALEVAPAVIGAIALLVTRKSYPLTTLVYVLVLVHCVILIVGGTLHLCGGAAIRLAAGRVRFGTQQL